MQINRAFFLAAAGTAGNLRQQLKRLFGSPQVAAHQPQIGIDNPDQRQARKVMSLGQYLRADENIHLPLLHFANNRRNFGQR